MKTGDKILASFELGEKAKVHTVYFALEYDGRIWCYNDMQDLLDGHIPVTGFLYAKEIPKPQYRPYTMKEFTAEWVKRGQPTITDLPVIGMCNVDLTLFIDEVYEWGELLSAFKWEDGSAMGVEVEE